MRAPTLQRLGRSIWRLLALWLAAACLAAAAAAPAAQFSLTWEVQRSVFTPENPGGRSLVAMTLTNQSQEPLPAQGWALYFNCLAGVQLSEFGGPFVIDNPGGTWYRLRPAAGFAPLGPGRSVRLPFFHPEVMVKASKAPVGPYLVFDSEGAVGHAIADYRMLPLTRAEQWDHGPDDPSPVVTAQDLFERNAAIAEPGAAARPPVFPTPQQFERRSGTLAWSAMPRISAARGLKNEVALAKSLLQPWFTSTEATVPMTGLHLAIQPIAGQGSPEAYELVVDPASGVTINGNSAAGVALGLQSLRELLPLAPQPVVALPALKIVDAPRFGYRGVMLDVARNFQPKATVLRLLDLMARAKLNKFHFHLTDDEGWRLEIPGLPELTSIGARRGHTLDSREHLQPAYGSGPDVSDPYGSGFFSAADYIEIVRYADARHIEVIPEIEMPGHSRAAVKAMESRTARLQQAGAKDAARYLLSDPLDRSSYRSAQLYRDNVMNPGLPSTYAFIDHVIGAVAALHRRAGVKLHTIHVGADEPPNGAWEKSPATRTLMQRERLTSIADVWDHFYDRVDRMLHQRGLRASGWEELGARKVQLRGHGKLIPNPKFTQRNFTLYVWNNFDDAQDLAYRMANAGYRTVLTPASTLYFDLAHNRNPEEPGVNWAGTPDLRDLFDFIPFDFMRRSPTDATPRPGMDGLTDYGQNQIMGLEGTLFTEGVRSRERIDYLVLPRLYALAERAWSADPAWTRDKDAAQAARLHDADWSAFVSQLGRHVLPQLDAQFPGVQYRIPPPGLRVVDGSVLVNQQIPGFTLRYSSDGSEPNANSPVVSGAIADKGLVQVAAFNRTGRRGAVSRIENPRP